MRDHQPACKHDSLDRMTIIESKKKNNKVNQSVSGGIYGLGWIGALVYYLSHATGFWEGLLGFLKALAWPAFLVYELLKYLGA